MKFANLMREVAFQHDGAFIAVTSADNRRR
jgi:hypothetical protein